MRRKTKKTMPQSTPTSVEGQQTMTQDGYVATLSSSKRKRREHEEVGDFESELDEPGSSDEKRQQTLTQMIHGVRPTPGYEDNRKILALKRKRGNMKTGEKRQQTLTQMTYGPISIPMVSDDEDEDDNDDNGYAPAIEHLAGHGIYKPSHERSSPKSPVHQHLGTLKHLHKWMTNQETQAHHLSSNHVASLRRPTKVKTENPKTPPRQRLLEVPSSQSPPVSPLSTQKSTERHSRYPLEERSSNLRDLLDSPSKGRIDATSNPAIRKLVPQTNKVVKGERRGFSPTSLHRIFQSTIQDSDEEEELGSDEEDTDTNNHTIRDKAQAVTYQIDLACTNTDPTDGLNENIEDGECIAENDLRLSAGSNLTLVPAERTNGESNLRETGQPAYIQFKSFQTIMHASQSEESQGSIGTGTEEAAAQLQTELESYTQRQNTRQSPGFRISHLEQSNQRIQDSNPIPTQSSHLSQATTVDSTQPSPHNAHHSALPLPVSPYRPPPLTIPSSLPSLLSSPNISRGSTSAESPSLKRTGAGIVTASQMVPESFDDYSIPPPPPWTDDDDDDYDDEELSQEHLKADRQFDMQHTGCGDNIRISKLQWTSG